MLSNGEFLLWCRRIGLSQEAQELIAKIRSSAPTRRVGGGRENVSGRYPSRKMGVTIQFESHRVELAFIYEMEHDADVLEYYDQAPSIRLDYQSANERHLGVMHTPDYFVIHTGSAGWQECKHERELERLERKSPHRYCRNGDRRWQCPPGEAYAAPFGLYYRLRSSAEIDWTLQRNIQYLEDYWRFDAVGVAAEIREIVAAEVAAAPGIRLSDLFRNIHGVASRDDVNRLIAAGDIYVDLKAAGVMEPDKARIFPNREASLACQHIENHLGCQGRPQFVRLAPGACIMLDGGLLSMVDCDGKTISLGGADSAAAVLPLETFEALVKDGRIAPAGLRIPEVKTSALAAASEGDLRVANQRFEIVQRYLNRQPVPDGTPVPKRTLRLWAGSYRKAEAQYGSGYLGLIPKTSQRGNRGSKLPEESRTLLNDYIEQNYETLKQKSKFAVWAALLHACQEKGIVAPSYATFCLATRRRPPFESVLKRQGSRAAYAHESFYWELEPTTPRHGDRPFEIGHVDHTELDVELICSHTGRVLGRPWMTLLTDAFSRRCLALCLAFDAPSYRSCMMILRDCVRRHGRLPQIIVIDGGPEFQSTYFDALLARYECIKKTRPPAKARFGSCCECLFGTANTRFIHNLQGNTQITRNIRQVTKSVDPRELATWTLAELHRCLSEFLFEVYDTIDHPALGQSPREAFRAGIEASGARAERMIPYDQEFLMITLPATPKGKAKVMAGRGVKINHIYYWSTSFQAPGLENQQVPVRYDPFDAGTAYAFLEGRWVRCHSEYYTIFHGHSEKELMLASNELRKRQQRHSQALVITAKRLAGFLQSVEADELLMAQRLRDQEAQTARNSLSVVPSMPPSSADVDGALMEANAVAANAETMKTGEVYGEF
jgi:transposase InsO family protein